MIQLKYPKEEFFKMSLIKKLIKVLVFSSFLGLSFSLTYALILVVPLKTDAQLKKTLATFAVISPSGVVPVADSPVVVIPCAPVNKDCMLIKDYLVTTLTNTEPLDISTVKNLDLNIRTELSKLKSSTVIRTNLTGTASVECPTKNCIIFSSALGEKNLFWIDLIPVGTSQEYPPSRAIEPKVQSIPSEISALISAINSFDSSISAGLSLITFSAQYAPFLNAIKQIQNYESDERFKTGIEKVKKVARLFEITQDTWQTYVNATRINSFSTTHFVSCEMYNNIRIRWNDAIGYEAIGKPTGGLFGPCFIGVNLEYKDGQPIHLIMYRLATEELNSSIKYILPKPSKIPVIQFPIISSEIGRRIRLIDLKKPVINLSSSTTSTNVADYLLEGKNKFQKLDYQGAIASYTQAIDVDPNLLAAYEGRGLAHLKLRNNQKAMQDFDRLIQSNPNSASAFSNRGIVYLRLNDYKSALADANRAIKIDFNLADPYSTRAAFYINQEDFDRALTESNRAIQLEPRSTLAYFVRGITYVAKENYKQAIEDFELAIQFETDKYYRGFIYIYRGSAYAELKEFKEANIDFERAEKSIVSSNFADADEIQRRLKHLRIKYRIPKTNND